MQIAAENWGRVHGLVAVGPRTMDPNAGRLDSSKEIAAYVRRGARTVQR